MELARLVSAGIEGVDGYLVQVEVSRNEAVNGIGRTTVVGLPDGAVRESVDRITPALANSGLRHSGADHVVVNLAPADRRKEGPAFDLAIALGLAATTPENYLPELPTNTLFLAELALDGSLRTVRGVLPAVLAARAGGLTRAVVAPGNAAEGAVVAGIQVYAATNLAACVAMVKNAFAGALPAEPAVTPTRSGGPCLSDVLGQEQAKRALAIAAAGNHNVLMLGPPGSGKTMLARRLPGLMPDLELDEALDATRVHSVSGLLPHGIGLLSERPFRSPHHSVSFAGLVGGGAGIPRPGEVSLAHHGVLFLDELPEFKRTVLETLRQPLEDGYISISRAGGRLRFPSRCLLVAAMNPCPCGFLGHPTRRCVDGSDEIHRYRNKISGPLLDRIDIHLEVPAQKPEILLRSGPGETTAVARERVTAARQRMLARQGMPNGSLDARGLKTHLHADDEAISLLQQAAEELGLSARANDRILKVARTIADLDARDRVTLDDVAEGIGYRVLDRPAA